MFFCTTKAVLKWGGSRSILLLILFYILQTYCLYPALFIRCHRRATEIPKKKQITCLCLPPAVSPLLKRATAVSWATLSKISRMRFLTLHCYLTQIVTETETHYFFPLLRVCLCGSVGRKSVTKESTQTVSARGRPPPPFFPFMADLWTSLTPHRSLRAQQRKLYLYNNLGNWIKPPISPTLEWICLCAACGFHGQPNSYFLEDQWNA